MQWVMRDYDSDEPIQPDDARYAVYDVRRTIIENVNGEVTGVLLVELVHKFPE